MTTISIKTGDDGSIVNRYIGKKDGEWIQTDESDWPNPDPADNEVPRFYYNSGTISVEYETIEEDEFET